MVLNPPVERLDFALMEMVALEERLQRTVASLRSGVSAHTAARGFLDRLEEITCTHLDALFERIQIVPHDGPKAHAEVNGSAAKQSPFGELHPVSKALGVAFAMVQEAIIGYSIILPNAVRAGDSWVTADEGTTAHISRRHTQEYMGVAGQITALIHDVVLWELDGDGFVCRCTCPSCSIGR